jgi:hypothetical protein
MHFVTFSCYHRLCISTSPQNRHPERSASQIYHVTEHWWRGVEGPRGCLFYPCRSELSTTQARTGQIRHGLSTMAENQELASILLCPAATSTFSAAIPARFTLASPATCISASCNIRRGRWKVSLRPIAASAYSILKSTKAFAQPSLGKNNSKAGGAKRSSTSFARSIPSSKTWQRSGDGR